MSRCWIKKVAIDLIEMMVHNFYVADIKLNFITSIFN